MTSQSQGSNITSRHTTEDKHGDKITSKLYILWSMQAPFSFLLENTYVYIIQIEIP